jgi:hypothetical protein
MSVITLKQLIEEHDTKKLICRIYIGGALLPSWTSLDFQFSIGEVPTAVITVPSNQALPVGVQEEASVQVWMGFQAGVVEEVQMVFGGAVVDSVGNNGHEVIIDCVMDGPRKLAYSYNRTIDYDFSAVIAQDTVEDILNLAGVDNYYVELDPWVLGTAAPQSLEFSTYGDAINKIAEVDGSPWYALPTGMVRVDRRDPIPSDNPRRVYHSNILTGIESTSPTSISVQNSDAKPRINDIARRKFRDQVGNFITVNGSIITTLGPNGEQNSNQIFETVDGASGQFPNGAFWIPTPPLFQHFVFTNELIDTAAKAFETATRYFFLKNRLFEEVSLSVPADPDVFLGSTVKIVDPHYSGASSLYFVKGYRTHVDSSQATTELQLTGGDESGTNGFASPFAEFFWKHTVIHNLIPGGEFNLGSLDFGPVTDLGGKFCIDLPAGTGPISLGGGRLPGTDRQMILIGLDGSASQDFDGYITDWEWSDDQGHAASGEKVTIAYDPTVASLVQITLLVTDNSGRTATITKTVYIVSDYDVDNPLEFDSSLNDTVFGGGVAIGNCTLVDPDDLGIGETEVFPQPLYGPGGCNGMELAVYVAAGDYAMGTLDNRTWNDLTKVAAGVSGQFISVASGYVIRSQKAIGIFGTDQGEIVKTTDHCVTGTLKFIVPGGAAIECIVVDGIEMGIPLQGETYEGVIPQYSQGSPGILGIPETYQLALKAGFEASAAVIAVAVMIAESGLVTNATNTTGNTPPSTDRGIAQFNDYWHPEVSDACAFDPECAIREMYRVSSGGTDFSQWAAYTAGTYRQSLSLVQELIGVIGSIGSKKIGYEPSTTERAFKIWAGTSDGEVYYSTDSGETWNRWGTAFAGYPVKKIITSSKLAHSIASTNIPFLAVFGGDTSNINSLIGIAVNNDGGFMPLSFSTAMKAAIDAAGGGFTIQEASLGEGALLIGFDGGVSPRVWFATDPINDPESWYPAIDDVIADPYSMGITTAIEAVASEYHGQFVIAGPDGVSRTEDNENFLVLDIQPDSINDIFWLGTPGLHLAASNDGVLLTMDGGTSWGSLRPNSTFSTTWPAGALAHQIVPSIGPRLCSAVGGIPPPPPVETVWDSTFGTWWSFESPTPPYSFMKPFPNRKVIAMRIFDSNGPTPVMLGNDITITDLGTFGPYSHAFATPSSPSGSQASFKFWLLENNGPNPDWGIDQFPSSFIPGRRATAIWVARASANINNAITIVQTSDEQTFTASPPYNFTLSTSDSLPAAIDNKDVVFSTFLHSGHTWDEGWDPEHTTSFNGNSPAANEIALRNIGPTIMPSTMFDRFVRSSTGVPGPFFFYTVIIQFKLTLNE